MSFAAYQRATSCKGEQPGARALLVVLLERYDHGSNWGIFVCRKVRGSATSFSLHAEGRALDVRFPIGDPQGNALVKALLPHVGELGVQAVIYERRFYSAASPSGRAYAGVNPHNDHVHIELGWPGALHLTTAKARAILSGSSGQGSGKTVAAIGDHGPVGAFPLKAGHWYGRVAGSAKAHDGSKTGDRLAIRAIQREVGAEVDGRYGDDTLAAVRAWQKRYRLDDDGATGIVTWDRMRVA